MSAVAGAPREHTHGHGRCSGCGGVLAPCSFCGCRTLHRVRLGTGAGVEYVCENRCSGQAQLLRVWRGEMRRALQRLEQLH